MRRDSVKMIAFSRRAKLVRLSKGHAQAPSEAPCPLALCSIDVASRGTPKVGDFGSIASRSASVSGSEALPPRSTPRLSHLALRNPAEIVFE